MAQVFDDELQPRIEQITVGDFIITELDDEKISIVTQDGEGGNFSLADFEAIIAKFFDENF